MNPEADLAASRLWAVDRAPYLASALFALTPVWTEGIGTFGIDARWRLYVDPMQFERWTIAEAGSVLIHEVHHLLRDHAGRALTLGVEAETRRRFNVAADLEINDDLEDLSLPSGLHPAQIGLATGELAEIYYGLIAQSELLTGWQCGSGAHGVIEPWEHADGDDAISAVEADLIRQSTASEIRSFQAQHGTVSAGLCRWADGFLEPSVNWRTVLAAAVRSGVISASGAMDFTYSRPSRRGWPFRPPAAVLPTMRRPVPRVAVVIDTSASMSTAHLDVAVAEVRGVLVQVGIGNEYVTVLCCDAAITSAERVFGRSALHLVGGGFTDMRVGIDAAVALHPVPDLVIVLTDGLTPWPSSAPRPRVIVAVIGEHGDGPDWAQVIKIALPGADGSVRSV